MMEAGQFPNKSVRTGSQQVLCLVNMFVVVWWKIVGVQGVGAAALDIHLACISQMSIQSKY